MLFTLDHLPAMLPVKSTFFWGRFDKSIDELQQIALQNKVVPGERISCGLANGSPNINLGMLEKA